MCLIGFSGTLQAVRLTGSCPMNHSMEHMRSAKMQKAIKQLADSECSSCHGLDGNGIKASGDVPYLAGQKFMYLCARLDECRKEGQNCKDHEDIAAQLTDSDIVGLAQFYSHMPSHKWNSE